MKLSHLLFSFWRSLDRLQSEQKIEECKENSLEWGKILPPEEVEEIRRMEI
ncbi:MAG: hypothetical protein QG605_983 [Euryarchaeota archaeon]|jgi:hypothetical protein|nr:hypothetical protein [Euryarchaeota archaeon]